jgi:hypothetical protein
MTKPRFEYQKMPTDIEGLKFIPNLSSKQDNEASLIWESILKMKNLIGE